MTLERVEGERARRQRSRRQLDAQVDGQELERPGRLERAAVRQLDAQRDLDGLRAEADGDARTPSRGG